MKLNIEQQTLWDEAILRCRNACLEVGKDAYEASKSKDAENYVSGYQDASVDCDTAMIELLYKNQDD